MSFSLHIRLQLDPAMMFFNHPIELYNTIFIYYLYILNRERNQYLRLKNIRNHY